MFPSVPGFGSRIWMICVIRAFGWPTGVESRFPAHRVLAAAGMSLNQADSAGGPDSGTSHSGTDLEDAPGGPITSQRRDVS
jgi:hypothetical protein